jgi:hypothetical protein
MYAYTVTVDPATRAVTVTPGQEPDAIGRALGEILAQALDRAVAEYGQEIKIRREHAPICLECWAADENTRLIRPDEAAAARLATGGAAAVTGERFWCEVLVRWPDGRRLVRVDNETIGPGVPRLHELLTLPADEDVLDRSARS